MAAKVMQKHSPTTEETSDNIQYLTFVENFSRLVDAVAPVVDQFARETLSKKLILVGSFSEVSNTYVDNYKRATKLLEVIMSKIKENVTHFNTVVAILQKMELTELAHDMKTAANPETTSPGINTSDSESGNIAPGFQCPCGHCNIKIYFRDKSKCPKFAEVFPYLHVEHLSKDEKETLQHQLIGDVNKIIEEFQTLLSIVFESLQRNKTTVQEITTTLFLSAGEGSLKAIQTAHGVELEKITTVSHILRFLIQFKYISFINYGIIEKIVKQHCKECETNMDEYLKNFQEFSKRNVFEIPSNVHGLSSPSNQLLVVKVIDEKWFGAERDTSNCLFTLNDIRTIQIKIAEVIGHNRDQQFIHLVDIGKGCLQLAFTIWPCHQGSIFPLTILQLNELKRYGVIVLYQPKVQSLPSPAHSQTTCTDIIDSPHQIDTALGEITQRSKDVLAQNEAIKAYISKRIEKLHQALDERKGELMKQLHLITQNKQKCLQDQQEELQAAQTQLESVAKQGQASSTQVEGKEVISLKAEDLKPRVDADIKFVVSSTTDIRSLCGELFTTIPGKCRSKLTPEKIFTTKKENVAMLEIFNFDEQPIMVDATAISCELVSEISNEKSSVTVTPMQEVGQYELKYTPTIKGRHRLHIKINHQEIKESPFTIKAKASNHLKSLGQPINDTKYNEIWTPHGIMLSHNNEIVVTNWQDNCVSVISPGENIPYSFDGRIRSLGKKIPHQFNRPHQIAQDKHGNFYVTNFFNGRVQKFSKDWQFLKSSSVPLLNPAGIAYNPENESLYVAEEGNHCIQVINTELVFSGTPFGTAGSEEGELNQPWGIAVHRGKVYVTDRMNKRIQVFGTDGKYVGKIGEGELQNPIGIAINSDGHIFVSESGEGYRIAVFDLQGHILREFGGEGDRQEAVGSESPNRRYRGIAVDDCGVVYVCDETGNCVLLF